LVLLLFNRGGSLCPLACPVKFRRTSEAYLTGAVKKTSIGLISRFDPRHMSIYQYPSPMVPFPGLDKPEKTAATNVYHFYQAASLRRHTLLRELLPKNKLILV